VALIPVFISSTFRDFHQERDILIGPVRERLDEALAPFGCQVELIDLRWGIDTSQDSKARESRRIVDVCLGEIDRSRPLFLGLVGERYGSPRTDPYFTWLTGRFGVPEDQLSGLSWTALEFGHATGWGSGQGEGRAVMVRSITGPMPPGWTDQNRELAASFRKEVADGLADGVFEAAVSYSAVSDGVRLDLDHVTPASGHPANTPASFEQLAFDLLGPMVKRRAAATVNLEDSATAAAERLFREARWLMVGRSVELGQIVSAATAGQRVTLVGASGSGKSTLLSAAAELLNQAGVVTVSLWLGASPADWTTRHLVQALGAKIAPDLEPLTDDASEEDWPNWWNDALKTWCGTGSDVDRVILVDGIDLLRQAPLSDQMWPFLAVPDGVGLVVSTTKEPQADYLSGPYTQRISIGELTEPAVRQAAELSTRQGPDVPSSGTDGGLYQTGRSLPGPVLDILAAKPRQPLWVRLAVDILADMDGEDFDSFADSPDQGAAIIDWLTARAAAFPEGLAELADVFLRRCQDRVGQAAADRLLGSLAQARSGLTAPDLEELVPPDVPNRRLVAARLRRALGRQLRPLDQAGRYGFSHQVIGLGAGRRALPDTEEMLADLLVSRAHQARQAVQAGQAVQAVQEGGGEPLLGFEAASNLDHRTDSQEVAGPAVFDVTSQLDAVWHILRTAQPGHRARQALLADVLRADPPGLDSVLMEALDSAGQTGLDHITALTADDLGPAGIETLAFAEQHAGRELLPHSADRIRLASHLAELSDALVASAGAEGRNTPEALHSLMLASARLGAGLLASGKLDDAAAAFSRSLRASQQLVTFRAGALGPLRDLSVSLSAVGRISVARGRLTDAVEAFEQALEIRRQLLKTLPDSVEQMRDVSKALAALGRTYHSCGDLAKGKATIEEGLRIARLLHQGDPGAIETLRDVSVLLSDMGRILRDSDDLSGAAAAFDEALEVDRRLQRLAPDAVEPLRDLSISLTDRGRIYQSRGDLDNALRVFQESVEIDRRLQRLQPDAVQPLRDLSVSLDGVGRVYLARGDLEGASKLFEESLRISRQLVQITPDSAEAQRDLSVALSRIGQVRQDSGDLAGAIEPFEEALKIDRQLLRLHPQGAQTLRDLSVSLTNLGRIHHSLGNREAAAAIFEEALQIDLKLRQARPDSVEALSDLLASLTNLGQLRHSRGDLDGAAELIEQALVTVHDLVRLDPDEPQWRRYLLITLNGVSHLRRERGDLAGAREAEAEAARLNPGGQGGRNRPFDK
jgi:tetratricopeptide (TPR) repeat protein/energy-coupling factor transporter ATP-binding protein EcfA2